MKYRIKCACCKRGIRVSNVDSYCCPYCNAKVTTDFDSRGERWSPIDEEEDKEDILDYIKVSVFLVLSVVVVAVAIYASMSVCLGD